MKNYVLPIVIILALVVVGEVYLHKYTTNKPATSSPVTENTVTTPGDQQAAVTNTPATKEPVSLSQGITLTVSSPANNTTVRSSSVTVRGKTIAGAEVFVNDLDTKADANGNFSVTLKLDEGDNYILVAANDAAGNYAEKELTVTYTP